MLAFFFFFYIKILTCNYGNKKCALKKLNKPWPTSKPTSQYPTRKRSVELMQQSMPQFNKSHHSCQAAPQNKHVLWSWSDSWTLPSWCIKGISAFSLPVYSVSHADILLKLIKLRSKFPERNTATETQQCYAREQDLKASFGLRLFIVLVPA